MRTFLFILLLLVATGVVFGLRSFFMVSQTEQALVFRFGQHVAIYNEWGQPAEPGLKFKLPWDNVVLLDRRNLVLDTTFQADRDEDLIIASDQQRLNVDAFARWRISDPLLFYQSLSNVEGARDRLSRLLNAAVREVLGTVETTEIISGQRAELMRRIQETVSRQVTIEACPAAAVPEGQPAAALLCTGWGVEIIDVKIRRVELPRANRRGVFERMAAERRQEADRIRAEGEEEAQVIRAEADREALVIRAQATEEAERTRGEGDAERNQIFAAAYSQDPEFFAFYRAMRAYETAINEGTTMLLAPDNDFFSYFSNEAGPNAGAGQ
jgi:membrane protease subunit HflC